jgi:diaminohydroxyphosphoribosylaminopyrimidine deaminase/5-amino-6-(5-phosphoribosylamino)uracil reductase
MNHEKWMYIAYKASLKGLGYVQPNPLVGAALVHNDQLISVGYHRKWGEKHAEIDAIDQALQKGVSLDTCTLYVTLEPCVHKGKTPPCVDRILLEKIPKVVVGLQDPNPIVHGKGIQKLREHGVIVTEKILTEPIVEANRMYIKWMTKKTPWISLKLALSLDGFMASKALSSRWISSEESRKIVHQMRMEHASILVGAGTILQDDPQLTVRDRDQIISTPTRIILDRQNRIQHSSYQVFTQPGKTVLFSPKELFHSPNLEHIHPPDYSPTTIQKILYEKNIQSIFIEGGSSIASAFYPIVDRFYFFLSPTILSQGLSPFHFPIQHHLSTRKVTPLQSDLIWELEPCLPES